jgi:hypothetical protein
MGKRSNFERRQHDFYPTPASAVSILLASLGPSKTFVEPCAGDGRLADMLEIAGHTCTYACDIEPRRPDIRCLDAFDLTEIHCLFADMIITNPPWSRELLHPMIMHFIELRPTWLLFDADWAYTKQAKPYLQHCVEIVPVGRVKWIENSPYTGKENCAWYLFDKEVVSYIKFKRG